MTQCSDGHARTGYTYQPKNWWRPLVPRVAAWIYDGTMSGPIPHQLELSVETRALFERGHRGIRLTLRRRKSNDMQSIERVCYRAWAVRVQWPLDIRARMRSCLNGTGYKMGTFERTLAHAAHLRGLRGDPVYERHAA